MNPFTPREVGCGSGQAAETVRPRLGVGIWEEQELHVKVKFSTSPGKLSGQASADAIGSKSGGASRSSSSDSQPSSAPSWLHTQARCAHLWNGEDSDCNCLAELPRGPSGLTDPSVMSARSCAQ